MSHTIGQAKEDAQESNSNSNQSPQNLQNSGTSSSKLVSGLSDADYEFLFNQLLEGIAHGWHDRRIIKFFQKLGDRGKQDDWVAWLDRLGSKLSKLPVESKRQLGTLMIRFGELTQSATEVKQIGAASRRLGRELLFGNNNVATIWEYVGPDLSPETEPIETEQELSERLPSDFEALADAKTSESELVEEERSDNESNLNLNIEEIIDLLVPGEKNSSEEEEISLEDETESSQKDTSSDLISADELWAAELPAEPETDMDRKASSPEPELDLTLDSDSDLADLDSSYDEEFEFEPEERSPNAEVFVPEQKQSAHNQGVAADLQPELPISAPNKLTDIDRAFEIQPDVQSSSANKSIAENMTTPVEDRQSELDLELTAKEPAELESLPPVSSVAANLDRLERQNELDSFTASKEELDESTLELIESWFNLGLKQVSAGEYDKAIASWDKALNINANLPEAWHNRGSALGRLGNYEAAVKSFQNALEIDPHNYQAWNDRAHALYQLQEWSAAIDSWTRAIEIMPGNHLFWYNRGCSLEQLAKWTEAIASYEKALEIKPDFQPGRSRYINLVADNSRPN